MTISAMSYQQLYYPIVILMISWWSLWSKVLNRFEQLPPLELVMQSCPGPPVVFCTGLATETLRRRRPLEVQLSPISWATKIGRPSYPTAQAVMHDPDCWRVANSSSDVYRPDANKDIHFKLNCCWFSISKKNWGIGILSGNIVGTSRDAWENSP